MNSETKALLDKLSSIKGKIELLNTSKIFIEGKIKELEKEAIDIELCKNIVRKVALETQALLEYSISSGVTKAEQTIFDDFYELAVHFVERRGKTECDLLFKKDEFETDPTSTSGFGAVDVAAFALRISSFTMSKKSNPVFLLDEPFKHLKGMEANRRAIGLESEISKELGIQIITISDERAKREDIIEGADRVFIVSKLNNVSKVEVLE